MSYIVLLLFEQWHLNESQALELSSEVGNQIRLKNRKDLMIIIIIILILDFNHLKFVTFFYEIHRQNK